MCMDKRPRQRSHIGLSIKELSRLAKLGSMFRMERIRHLLKYKPNGKKGDTVVSPCDFHRRPLESPVNKGVPP